MLVVGVVFGGIRDEVVDVVRAFPPAQGQAADGGGDDHADEVVDEEVVRNGHVGGVVRGKDHLRPEPSEEDGAGAVPFDVKKGEHDGEEKSAAAEFPQVRGVVAFVESFGVDVLVQTTVSLDDLGLGRRVQGGIPIEGQAHFLFGLGVQKSELFGTVALRGELGRKLDDFLRALAMGAALDGRQQIPPAAFNPPDLVAVDLLACFSGMHSILLSSATVKGSCEP